MPHKLIPLSIRFARYVEKTDTCWYWTGYRCRLGYGRYRVHGTKWSGAHRVAYELHHGAGSIPVDREIDHLCRVRHCVNPTHLEAVTHAENMRRGNGICTINAGKTHCPQGHPYDTANTHFGIGGGRSCRTCNVAAQHRWLAKPGNREKAAANAKAKRKAKVRESPQKTGNDP